MNPEDEFLLASIEGPRRGQPWTCHVLHRFTWLGAGVALVTVTPPIAPGVCTGGRSKNPLRDLLLSPLHEGDSLAPVNRWPLFVYIYVLTPRYVKGSCNFRIGDVRPVDRGVIARTRDELGNWMYSE